MIRIKKKAASAVPAVLLNKGTALTKVLCNEYENGLTVFEFDSGIYGSKEVKEALIAIQDYKCCFCESKIGHIAYGDVEHFRPKAGWVQDKEQLNSPGYY